MWLRQTLLARAQHSSRQVHLEKKKPSAVRHHLHQSFKVDAFLKRAFQSEILKGMKSTIWVGRSWYRLAVPQSLQCPDPACTNPHINSLLCSFIGYTRAFTLKSMQKGVKSLGTRKRRAKHLGSACSSLNACMYSANLLWKDMLALGKVSRANMYNPFLEQVKSLLGRLRKSSSCLSRLFQYILLKSF